MGYKESAGAASDLTGNKIANKNYGNFKKVTAE